MMKMCHYDQQRTGYPSHAAVRHNTELRSLSPPRGKVFNPFVAFLAEAKEKKKKGKGMSWDRITLISLSSCDTFRLMFLTLSLQVKSRGAPCPHSQTRATVAILLH